jgi:hypothetical protein
VCIEYAKKKKSKGPMEEDLIDDAEDADDLFSSASTAKVSTKASSASAKGFSRSKEARNRAEALREAQRLAEMDPEAREAEHAKEVDRSTALNAKSTRMKDAIGASSLDFPRLR